MELQGRPSGVGRRLDGRDLLRHPRGAHEGDKERPVSITKEPTVVTGDTPEELAAELDRIK